MSLHRRHVRMHAPRSLVPILASIWKVISFGRFEMLKEGSDGFFWPISTAFVCWFAWSPMGVSSWKICVLPVFARLLRELSSLVPPVEQCLGRALFIGRNRSDGRARQFWYSSLLVHAGICNANAQASALLAPPKYPEGACQRGRRKAGPYLQAIQLFIRVYSFTFSIISFVATPRIITPL